MHTSNKTLLLALLSTTPFTYAQTTTSSAAGATASPDGDIVPFSSGLPACASYCGPLFDVQGACSPPNIAAVNDNCFCTDSRLTALDNAGTTGVSTVCGTTSPYSCTSASDLQAIKTWYDNFCNTKHATTSTAAGGATSTSTGTSSPKSGSSHNNSWYAALPDFPWCMLIVMDVQAWNTLQMGDHAGSNSVLHRRRLGCGLRLPP